MVARLPSLSDAEFNARTLFQERDFINPEIREMFNDLGLIESYGSGIGEAKRACEENGSPKIEYKIFEPGVDIASVRIPMNQKYGKMVHGNLRNDSEKMRNEPKKDLHAAIADHGYSRNVESAYLHRGRPRRLGFFQFGHRQATRLRAEYRNGIHQKGSGMALA